MSESKREREDREALNVLDRYYRMTLEEVISELEAEWQQQQHIKQRAHAERRPFECQN